MGKALFNTGCPRCGVIDPPEGFRKAHRNSRPWCNLCARISENADYTGRFKRYYADNKEAIAERKRLSYYGISVAEFEAMVKDGICQLCRKMPVDTSGRGRLWVVDHDHGCCPGPRTCGKCVRGIICHGCNKALGLVGDSVETLLAMVKYLVKEDPLS